MKIESLFKPYTKTAQAMPRLVRMACASVLAVLMLASPALATDAPLCANSSNFDLPEAGAGLARVTGAPRTYFHSDYPDGCPDNGSSNCRQRSFVVPGDTVITGITRGAFICAQFIGANGRTTVGYLRQSEIAAQQVDHTPPLSRWFGAWENDDSASIRLRVQGAQISIDGNATWNSGRPGGVNVGSIQGTATPRGNVINFTDEYDTCKVTMTLLPGALVVSDNKKCGGNNVSFSGVYRR